MSEMSGTARLGTAGLAAQGAGAAMGAVGSFYAAKGQKMQLRLQARMAELNAKIAEGQARDLLMQGQRAEQSVRMRGAEIKSAQRVSMGASGVDLASETAVALQTSTDYLSELDANTAKANALRAAWGQRFEAVNLRGQAGMARASAASISPFMSLGSSILGSASQIGMSYMQMQDMGVFNKGGTT